MHKKQLEKKYADKLIGFGKPVHLWWFYHYSLSGITLALLNILDAAT